MGVGPITYLEIEAFQRTQLVKMTAWEVALLRCLDDAVRVAMANQAKPTKAAPETLTPDIPTSNTPALKTFFRGLAAQKAAEMAQA